MKYFLKQYKNAFMMSVVNNFEASNLGGENLKNIVDKINEDKKLDKNEKKEMISIIEKSLEGLDGIGRQKRLEQIKKIIEQNITGEVKNKLLELISSFEKTGKSPEYGMEGLREAIPEKSTFGKILNYKPDLNDLPVPIKEKLGNLGDKTFFDLWVMKKIGEKINGLGLEKINEINNISEKIGVILWKKILEKIGFASAGSFVVNPIMEKFKNISEKIGKKNEKKENSENEKGFGLGDMKELFDGMENFDSSDEEKNESLKIGPLDIKIPKGMGKLIEYIDSLVDTNFDNLNKLIKLAENNGLKDDSKFQNLLDNPVILEKVLEDGKYKGNGFDIDLEKGKIILGNQNPKNIEEAKKKFMAETIKLTNKKGAPIDGFLGMVKEGAEIFKKLGFDSSEIKDFVEGLYDIPIIGPLLKILFGKFFGEVSKELEKSELKDKYKKLGKNLDKFISNAKIDDLPFKLEKTKDGKETEKLNEKDFNNINKFLEKIEKEEKKQKVTDSILKTKDFWKKILTEEIKETDSDILKQIKTKIKELKGTGEKISKTEFFKNLAKIDFKEKQEENKTENKQVSEEEKQKIEQNNKAEEEKQKEIQAKIIEDKKKLKQEKDKIATEKTGLIEVKKTLEIELKQLEGEKNKTSEIISKQEKKLKRLEKQKSKIEGEIEKKKKEVEKKEEKIDNISKSFLKKLKNAENRTLKAEKNKLELKIDKLTEEKQKIKIKIGEIRTNIGRYPEGSGSGIIPNSLLDKKQKLEKQIEEKKGNLKIINDKLGIIETKEKKVSKQSQEITKKEKEIKEKENLQKFELSLKTKKLEELKGEKTKLDGEILEKQTQINKIREEVNKLIDNSSEEGFKKTEKLLEQQTNLKEDLKKLENKKTILEKTIKQKETQEKTQTPEVVGDDIIKQLDKATGFPIKLSDGREINYDKENYYITIGNEKFKIVEAMGKKGEKLDKMLESSKPNIEYKNGEIKVIIKFLGNDIKFDIPKEKFNETLLSLMKNGNGELIVAGKKFKFKET